MYYEHISLLQPQSMLTLIIMMRGQNYRFHSIFFIINTLIFISASQIPMSMSSNERFAYTGRLTIDCSTLTSSSQFSVTYPKPMVSSISSNTAAYVSCGQLKLSLVSIPQISIKISLAYIGASSMSILIQSIIFSDISRLSVNYLLIKWQDSFRNAYLSNFMMQQIQDQSINTTNQAGQSVLLSLNRALNSSGFFKTFNFINGLQLSYTGISPFTFEISSYLKNNDLNITFTVNQAILGKFSFIICVYEIFFNINPNNKINFRIDTFLFRNISQNPFVANPFPNTQITSSNAFIGVSSISVKDQFFSFTTSSDASGITISSDQAFLQYGFTYLIVQSNYCPLNYSYFNPFLNGCYNTCSGNYLSNDFSLICSSNPIFSQILGPIIVTFLTTAIVYVVIRQRKTLRHSQSGKEIKQVKNNQSQNENSRNIWNPSPNLYRTKEDILQKDKAGKGKDMTEMHLSEEKPRFQIKLNDKFSAKKTEV